MPISDAEFLNYKKRMEEAIFYGTVMPKDLIMPPSSVYTEAVAVQNDFMERYMGKPYLSPDSCTMCKDGVLLVEHLSVSKDNYCTCPKGKTRRNKKPIAEVEINLDAKPSGPVVKCKSPGCGGTIIGVCSPSTPNGPEEWDACCDRCGAEEYDATDSSVDSWTDIDEGLVGIDWATSTSGPVCKCGGIMHRKAITKPVNFLNRLLTEPLPATQGIEVMYIDYCEKCGWTR